MASMYASSPIASLRSVPSYCSTGHQSHSHCGGDVSPRGGDSLTVFGNQHPQVLAEPEPVRLRDRLAPARDPELAVDGDRLRLDRVPRDVQLLGDLAEGEV